MPENAGFGRFPPETLSVAEAMANASRMEILSHLEAAGPARFTDLGELTGLQSGALSPHLKDLQRGGLVQKVAFEQAGQVTERYVLSPFGRRLLDQVHAAFVPPTSTGRDRFSVTSGAQDITVLSTLEEGMATSGLGDVVELEV